MNKDFDFENPKEGIDKWLVAFKYDYSPRVWVTMEIPGFISKRTIELILDEINQHSDIAFKRVVMGVQEPKSHKYLKGEFLGI